MSKFASLLGAFGEATSLGVAKSGGGGGLKQSVTKTTSLPKRTDTEVADAAKRAKQALLRRRGRGSTILTGGRGLLDDLASKKSPEAKSTFG